MNKKKDEEILDERPWGNFRVIRSEPEFKVKRIEVNPRSRLSLQRHTRREEFWTVVLGSGIATVDGKEIKVEKRTVVHIPMGARHRMANVGESPLVFIEVQLGSYLGEDDIERFEDDYNRI